MLAIFILGSSGVALSFNIEKFNEGGIAISRFIDDPLENESRIFRSRLDELMAALGREAIVRYPLPIESIKQAEKVLLKEKRHAVAWGTSDRLSLLIESPTNSKLADLIGPQLTALGLAELGNFYLVRSPDYLSLLLGHNIPSDIFLTYFLSGIQEADPTLRESMLLFASRITGNWRTFGHRAFPYWLLGSTYLIDAIDGGQFEPAALECADRMLRRAAVLLSDPLSNPELYSAIFNNHAILLYVRSKLENQPELSEYYQREFSRAKHKIGRNVDNDRSIEHSAWKAAQANLDLLFTLNDFDSERKERKVLKARGLVEKKRKIK